MCLKFFFTYALLSVVTSKEVNIFPSLPIAVQKSQNELCTLQSKKYLENLDNLTLWAYEMRDASAQSATSVLRGNGFNMGNLKQCLSANAPFPTRYCLAVITADIPKTKTHRDPYSLIYDPNENVINRLYDYKDDTRVPRNSVKMAWCIPASCTASDAKDSLNSYLKDYDHPLMKENVSFTADVPTNLCQASNSKPGLDLVDSSFLVISGILILLVVVATILDYNVQIFPFKQTEIYRYLMAFSAINNYKNLSKPETSEKPLKILYGLKTVSLLVIIAGHRFALVVAVPILSFDDVEQLYRDPWTSGFHHADLFVDTFFFLGGILVTYTIMGIIDKRMFNPLLLIISRYLRLTPVYAFVIFFHASILYHTGTGPLWELMIGQERSDCRTNWWTGILYISNIVNSDHMCMIHSWFLPCDFHYFLLALILVYLLHKNKTVGFTAIILCCLVTMSSLFYLIYANNRPPFLRFLPNFLANSKAFFDFEVIYIKTYTRGLPYFVGMGAGYMYYTLKGTDYKISKVQSWVILLISYVLILTLLLTGIVYYSPYHKYDAIESSFYGSFNRLGWGLATFGFIYSISFGQPGIVYNFLTMDIFIPLSKLSYSAYLCHVGFQLRDIANSADQIYYVMFDVGLTYLEDVVWTFIIALILYLMIEEPFRKIMKMIMIKDKKTNISQNLPQVIEMKVENSKIEENGLK